MVEVCKDEDGIFGKEGASKNKTFDCWWEPKTTIVTVYNIDSSRLRSAQTEEITNTPLGYHCRLTLAILRMVDGDCATGKTRAHPKYTATEDNGINVYTNLCSAQKQEK